MTCLCTFPRLIRLFYLRHCKYILNLRLARGKRELKAAVLENLSDFSVVDKVELVHRTDDFSLIENSVNDRKPIDILNQDA